jgi:hypothetical protein
MMMMMEMEEEEEKEEEEDEDDHDHDDGGGGGGGKKRGRGTQRNVCSQNHLPLLSDPSCTFHKSCNESHSSNKGTSFFSTIFVY